MQGKPQKQTVGHLASPQALPACLSNTTTQDVVTIMRLSPRAPKPQESSHSSGQCRQVPGAILGIPGQSEASQELRASSPVAREFTEQTRNVKKRVPRGIIQKSQYTHAKIAVQNVLEMPGNQ